MRTHAGSTALTGLDLPSSQSRRVRIGAVHQAVR